MDLRLPAPERVTFVIINEVKKHENVSVFISVKHLTGNLQKTPHFGILGIYRSFTSTFSSIILPSGSAQNSWAKPLLLLGFSRRSTSFFFNQFKVL
jgi:hypothetical protein